MAAILWKYAEKACAYAITSSEIHPSTSYFMLPLTSEMIMNCSWMVLEQFMCSSWTLIHEQFMNYEYPWTWNGQVHEVGEVHELGVHKFEFMNLWVHELFVNYSSWIVHELLVHDLFMNDF